MAGRRCWAVRRGGTDSKVAKVSCSTWSVRLHGIQIRPFLWQQLARAAVFRGHGWGVGGGCCRRGMMWPVVGGWVLVAAKVSGGARKKE